MAEGMTVRQLIRKLSKLDENLVVLMTIRLGDTEEDQLCQIDIIEEQDVADSEERGLPEQAVVLVCDLSDVEEDDDDDSDEDDDDDSDEDDDDDSDEDDDDDSDDDDSDDDDDDSDDDDSDEDDDDDSDDEEEEKAPVKKKRR